MNGLLMIQVTVQLKSTPWLIFPHDLQVGEFWIKILKLEILLLKNMAVGKWKIPKRLKIFAQGREEMTRSQWEAVDINVSSQGSFNHFVNPMILVENRKRSPTMLTLKSVRDNQCLKFMFQKWPKTPNTYPNPWLKSYPCTWGDVSFSLLASTYSSRLFTWGYIESSHRRWGAEIRLANLTVVQS